MGSTEIREIKGLLKMASVDFGTNTVLVIEESDLF